MRRDVLEVFFGLGRGPVLGRGFAPGEDTPGPTGVAIMMGAGTRGLVDP